MRILSIESSCDETSASVLEKKENTIQVVSNVTATSLSLHATTGGIIPESAAREQVKYILPVITKALIGDSNRDAAIEVLKKEIDSIAVTNGPGLIGSLLVGVETAKSLSFSLNKSIIPVNHLIAHIYANFIDRQISEINFPFIGLIISGGHTDLIFFENHDTFKWLGGTRDDAAGEALDKIGRLLNLSYPAGPEIEQRASLVKSTNLRFKSPLIGSDDYDFSFSGLKTEVLRFVEKEKHIDTNLKNQISFATQKAIFDVIVKKTMKASVDLGAKMILVGGGVSANQTLRDRFAQESKIPILFPDKKYSTDNAAMIGSYALLNYKATPWQEIAVDPEMYFL